MATTIERRQVGSLRVTVNGPNAATEYAGISAIGIGHNHKDLVLVPADGGKPIEVKPDEWDALTIEKERPVDLMDALRTALPGGEMSRFECPSCGGPLRVHGGSASFQKGALMCDAEGCNSVWTEREVKERAL